MGYEEFEKMSEEEAEEIEKKPAFAPRFEDGESVIMLIYDIAYDNDNDTFILSLSEIGAEDPRTAVDYVYLKKKDGGWNGMSMAHMRSLHQAIFGYKAKPRPEQLKGAVVGVEFKHEKYKPKNSTEERLNVKVKEYFPVSEEYKRLSEQPKQVYTDSADGW